MLSRVREREWRFLHSIFFSVHFKKAVIRMVAIIGRRNAEWFLCPKPTVYSWSSLPGSYIHVLVKPGLWKWTQFSTLYFNCQVQRSTTAIIYGLHASTQNDWMCRVLGACDSNPVVESEIRWQNVTMACSIIMGIVSFCLLFSSFDFYSM